jgi:peptide/nickel transport system permease protein/oligopeptide transport system permease protein
VLRSTPAEVLAHITESTAPPPPDRVIVYGVSTPWKRLRRNWIAMGSMVILVLMALFAIIVPEVISPEKRVPSEDKAYILSPPSGEFFLGTDLLRRDLLYRLALGARVSLGVGLAAALLNIVIGTSYGLVAGYFGGRVDAVMMRFVDIMYSIPRLIVVLVFINALDVPLKQFMDHVYLANADHGWLAGTVRGALNALGLAGAEHKGTADSLSRIFILIITLGFIEWLSMARIVRGQVLSLKERQYITASRALGQSHFRIITRHLLPNLMGIVITYLTLTIPAVILDESFLSFLGLGVQEPLSSWGALLKDGSSNINPVKSFWWLLVFPAATMSLTLLALNFLGDGLRDAFDPKEKR